MSGARWTDPVLAGAGLGGRNNWIFLRQPRVSRLAVASFGCLSKWYDAEGSRRGARRRRVMCHWMYAARYPPFMGCCRGQVDRSTGVLRDGWCVQPDVVHTGAWGRACRRGVELPVPGHGRYDPLRSAGCRRKNCGGGSGDFTARGWNFSVRDVVGFRGG